MFIFCSFGSLNSFTVRGQASDTAEIVEGEGISFGKENKTCLSGQCPQLISPAVIYGYTRLHPLSVSTYSEGRTWLRKHAEL